MCVHVKHVHLLWYTGQRNHRLGTHTCARDRTRPIRGFRGSNNQSMISHREGRSEKHRTTSTTEPDCAFICTSINTHMHSLVRGYVVDGVATAHGATARSPDRHALRDFLDRGSRRVKKETIQFYDRTKIYNKRISVFHVRRKINSEGGKTFDICRPALLGNV